MSDPEEHHKIEPPRVSVGEFLSEALEVHAEHQLLWELSSDGADAVRLVAKQFIDGQTQLFAQRPSDAEHWLERKDVLFRSPWLRYGIELELADRALRRVHIAGKRYVALDYGSLSKPLSDKSTRYVAEVVMTFALGFESASMALCGACLEQILKETLITQKIYTSAYLDRQRLGAMGYLNEARKNQLLSKQAFQAGQRIVEKRDAIMHKFMHEERIQKQLALDSIKDLIIVVLDLEKPAEPS